MNYPIDYTNTYTFQRKRYYYINHSTFSIIIFVKLPFSIHKKKFEEAEMIFESAISSTTTATYCIVLKGPTGCGKGFLIDKLIAKYGHLIRLNDIDTLPISDYTEYSTSNTNNFNDISSPKAFKCGNTLFPSLSFTSKITNGTARSAIDKRKVVSRLSDAHFFQYLKGFDKEYAQIKRSVEMLKTHSGILIIEFTDFEFEGSLHNYILKILKETFSSNLNIISMNSCTPTIIKKTLEPLNYLMKNYKDHIMESFNGDPRALLHDLYLISLNSDKNMNRIDSMRDFRTDFFHYVGKLLYPSKTGSRIFEDVSFWDLDYSLYLIFLQYYFPKFCPDLSTISNLNEYFCTFDCIPWKVLKHVSIENHVNACKYAPLLACFTFINDPNQRKIDQKFFSFTRPPPLNYGNEFEIRKKCRKSGLQPEELYLTTQ